MTEFDGFFADGFDDLLMTVGETGVYRPRAGGTRTITGIVNREPPQVLLNGEYVLPTLTFSVHADATSGVLASEVDAGDQIDIAVKPGQSREARTIFAIESSDGGVTVLAIK